jgi:hypothetical protein
MRERGMVALPMIDGSASSGSHPAHRVHEYFDGLRPDENQTETERGLKRES